MKTKHTPGPWRIGKSNSWNVIADTHTGDRPSLIASAAFGGYSANAMQREEVDSNAILIAAAPELLEALIALSDEFDKYDTAMTAIGRGHEDYGMQRREARRAILKATGAA